MVRPIVLFVLPALLVGTAWARLDGGAGGGRMVGLAALALLPALARPSWARVAAIVGVAFAAVWIVYGITPWALAPFDDRRFFGPLASRFRDGLLAFYDVTVPFEASEQPLMRDVVLLAVLGFCLAIALALVSRRPLVAAVLLLSGSIWPATLVTGNDLGRGAVTLAAVLILLALGGQRPTLALRPAVVTAALLVAAAVGASTSQAVAKPQFLSWQKWDFYDTPASPVGVSYVWNASYRPLKWPEKKTTVLKISGPKRNLYWRATTLDTFVGDRWVEDLSVLGVATGPVDLTRVGGDDLLPARAYERNGWIEADVKVEALRDRHLVGPSMPVAYDPRDLGSLQLSPGGVATTAKAPERGSEYAVWAYAPEPKPEQLAHAAPYPHTRRAAVDWKARRYLDIAPGLAVPPFGTPDRDAVVRDLLSRKGSNAIAPYRVLYQKARDVVGSPNNAYAAVVALEAWFRSEGGFKYDETPPRAGNVPPLIAFLRNQHGYCQHYAGAMALMLRYLGIPARVAVGFTSGSLGKDGTWTVTDHDAHAWVEAWFPGWGWLPFDPTPARGQLSGPYSANSSNFDAQGAGRVLDASALGGEAARYAASLTRRKPGEEGAGFRPSSGGYVPAVRRRGASLLKLLLLVAAAAALAIVLVKRGIRGRRFLTRDTRRIAAACRHELVDFLADQGITLQASATPRELAYELERRLGVDAQAFARALAAARYAPTGKSGVAAKRLRRELRLLRRDVRRRLGVPRRVRGAVSLRSLAA